MLFTLPSSFNWTANNFGATYTDAGLGTAVTSGAVAHLKGTPVSLLAGSILTTDVYGISIGFTGGNSTGAIRIFLADLLIDPNGASSWQVLIKNLIVSNPSAVVGGYWYYFPLYLKAGTSIGMQHQCTTGTISMRCLVQVYGKPSRPEMIKCGSYVESFGVTLASTTGTSVTAGTMVMGSYSASLGTTVRPLWWWQGGLAINEVAHNASCLFTDIAVGDTNTKNLVAEGIRQTTTSAEQHGKVAFGYHVPYNIITPNNSVFMRTASIVGADGNISGCAYGLGG